MRNGSMMRTGRHDGPDVWKFRGVLLAQQPCGNPYTWPARRDLSLRHVGLESLPLWSVARLYGHSHGNLPDTPTALSMDVGVDTHDFRPWHFDEITLLMTNKANAQSELHRRSPLK